MLRDPFPLLRPFSGELSTTVFAKADDVHGDAAAAEALGLRRAAGLHQAHGREVAIVREPSARTIRADAMLTDVKDLLLCIRWADCQNFVVLAPGKGVAGVIHAGWKGLLAGVIPATLEAVTREWGIAPAELVVGAGPSLCARCADFTDPATELPGLPENLRDGRHADLRAWAGKQFFNGGVSSERFQRMACCTRCEPDMFWTYRGGHREEVKAGRTNMLTASLR